MDVENISPNEAFRLIQEEDAIYLDVRTKEEFAEIHAKGSVNIPLFNDVDGTRILNTNFVNEVEDQFDPDDNIILGCRTGGRSTRATEMLLHSGFSNVSNLLGGLLGSDENPGWEKSDLPVEGNPTK